MVRLIDNSLQFFLILLFVRCARCSKYIDGKDTVLEQSLEDFKRLCPFTDLCFSTAHDNFTHRELSLYPCCFSCDCDVNCANACCPDKPERFLNEIETLEIKESQTQCVYAQIRPYSLKKLNGKPYNMIGNCPSNFTNEDIKVKCSREYHDFNFDQDDVKTLMPRSSETMNVTFKNVYCAVCHDAAEKTQHVWNTKVICKNHREFLLSNISEIHIKLSEESLCQILFEPSFTTPWYAVKSCSGEIDKCNVTGNWRHFDHSLESACLSYRSEYRGFKNVHCFLCNGHTLADAYSVCQHEDAKDGMDSFVALLDFNELEVPSYKYIETKCSSGSKFDPLKVSFCQMMVLITNRIFTEQRLKSKVLSKVACHVYVM
ncbi:uncharacterized protein LOC128559159 [Mercenaria mercenaria]|uniref:uncharacterized protein LOC128559159 n=1 Tax=Mercenaria mercenaria TaxID=6596 RepID=UPI00234F55FE|nr:uncharacterized protein LOC128559159 [Mercenaria mercenaria]